MSCGTFWHSCRRARATVSDQSTICHEQESSPWTDHFIDFHVNNFNGGTVSGNTASSNGSDGTISGNPSLGFYVKNFNGGTFSGNTASGNSGDGFLVNTFPGGTLSGNTATSNSDDGFQFGGTGPFDGDGFSLSNTATFGSNVSSDNTAQGYNIEGTPQTGKDTNTGNGGGNNNF